MSAANQPTWMARRRATLEVMRNEKPLDTSHAARAQERRLQGRLIQDGERTYRAYSADELIEIDSLAKHGRPGHPY